MGYGGILREPAISQLRCRGNPPDLVGFIAQIPAGTRVRNPRGSVGDPAFPSDQSCCVRRTLTSYNTQHLNGKYDRRPECLGSMGCPEREMSPLVPVISRVFPCVPACYLARPRQFPRATRISSASNLSIHASFTECPLDLPWVTASDPELPR